MRAPQRLYLGLTAVPFSLANSASAQAALRATKTLLAAMILIGVTSGRADAASILFENPYPPVSTESWCTSCDEFYRVWDTFVLTSDSTITQIDAALVLPTSGDGDIEYSVWDASRTTQLFSQTVALASLTVTPISGTTADVSAAITGLTLSAGTYYLSIYDETFLAWHAVPTPIDGSGVQTIGADPSSQISGDGNFKDFAFRIVGDPASTVAPVPEPATLSLLGLGLAGAAVRRRFRKRT